MTLYSNAMEQPQKNKFSRWNFLTIIIFELVSVDLTIYEIFENMRSASGNYFYMALIVVLSMIVFFFLRWIGREAFDVILELNKQT